MWCDRYSDSQEQSPTILGTPRHISSEPLCKHHAQVRAEQRGDAVYMATCLFQVTARDTAMLESTKQENVISACDHSVLHRLLEFNV